MLEVENLNQYYGGSHILRDVKMTVPDGKLTVLLGRNGVGKTTLLRCLMGVVPTESGRSPGAARRSPGCRRTRASRTDSPTCRKAATSSRG